MVKIRQGSRLPTRRSKYGTVSRYRINNQTGDSELIVLLTGASGFIGLHLRHALTAAGHQVVCALRKPASASEECTRVVPADFTRDFDADTWLPRLAGVDV